MDDPRFQQFFVDPQQTPQRRYEAIRAVILEDQSLPAAAARFGFAYGTLRNLVAQFGACIRQGRTPPFSLRFHAGGPPANQRNRAPTWRKAHLDIPKRLHKNIRYVEASIQLDGYDGTLRQIAVTGLGRERLTLFLANNTDITARDLVIRYARRNGIEDGLGSSVHFFQLACLASAVRLNVDLDVALTVIGNGCYRWLARKLKGFDKAKPKDLYRKFVETAGQVTVTPERIVVQFDRRSHNPIMREAALDRACPPIPWLGNRQLIFTYH